MDRSRNSELSRPERRCLVKSLQPAPVAFHHDRGDELAPRNLLALEGADKFCSEGPQRRVRTEKGEMRPIESLLGIVEIAQRGDLSVCRLGPVVIGCNRQVIAGHRPSDLFRIPMDESVVELRRSLVDGADRARIIGPHARHPDNQECNEAGQRRWRAEELPSCSDHARLFWIFRLFLERAKGFEPSTPTLARLCSTPELRPRPGSGFIAHGPAKCNSSGMAATPQDLFRRLSELGIATSTTEHPPVFTVEEAKALRGQIPGCHIKNLFLKDKRDQLWLVVCPEDRSIELKTLPALIGSARLS